MTETNCVGVAVDYSGFPSVSEQTAALSAAGAAEIVTISPMTMEDWHYRLREAIAAAPGVVVTALQAFGLSAAEILGALDELLTRGARLIVVDPALDEAAVRALAAVIAAVDEGGLIRTRAIIDSLVPGDTKSPPKARFVDAESFRRVASAQ